MNVLRPGFPADGRVTEDADPVWRTICAEAREVVTKEPLLASVLYATVLAHANLEDALAFHLASKLGSPTMPEVLIRDLVTRVLQDEPSLGGVIRDDLLAVRERDPASTGLLTPLMYYKGFHALESYRVGHWFWSHGRRELAYYVQNRVSEVFAVDIHPAARLGRGIFIDHGTGIVIGETAVIGDNVSMLQNVTLGGTGREEGDRHPKIHSGVLIGAGATVLGNIVVGFESKVGAGSVVLTDVPPHTTVAGVPARVVGESTQHPALGMDHRLPPHDDT